MKNKKEMNRFLPKGKKAAEMTIGTIIVIILALVVLVVIIYGFSTGWTNLWEKIIGFGGGKVNVQTIVQSCQLACTTSSTYDYCKARSLIEADSAGKVKAPRDVTCKELEGATYGLDACDITCAVVEKGTCSGTITSNCASNNDKGSSECVKLIGCKWTDNAQETVDITKGTCAPDSTILCSKYNDDRTTCEKISGCTFTATPA